MRVTIIGSNFAALAAIQKLRSLDPGHALDLTVISPKAEFFYNPSLIWIPSRLRNREDLKCDLGPFFERMGVVHHPGTVRAIEGKGRVVVTTAGDRIDNDGLIIASGAAYMQKAPGIERVINPCSGVGAAETARNIFEKLAGGTLAFGFSGNPKEPSAIRGGPLFEFLFGMDTQLRRLGKRDRFKLVFFTPMPEPGKRLGPRAVKGLLAKMKKHDVDLRLGKKIAAFAADHVQLEGGERFSTDLTLFIPGMCGRKWFADTGLELSEGGFFKADGSCRVAGGERVYVAGDAGSFPGPEWRAKQAHMAELQARTAATNLYAELKGRPAADTFRTELICIVDTLDTGMLVSRFNRFSLLLPPMRPLHWTKRFLEYKTFLAYR